MKISVKTLNPVTLQSNCIVAGVYSNGQLSPTAEKLNEASKGHIADIVKSGDIRGKAGDTLLLHKVPGIRAERILLAGCGEADRLNAADYFKIIRSVCTALQSTQVKEITCCLSEIEVDQHDFEWRIRNSIRIAGEVFYKVNTQKTAKGPEVSINRFILSANSKAEEKKASPTASQGEAIIAGMQFCRDLANLPGNICTPSYLAEQAKDLAKKFKTIRARVLTETQMEKLSMGSLLSVSRGSEEPARFIVLEYDGKQTGKPIVLVGKGVTFDSGGISLKPGAAMDEMKYDMCGAASVLGTLRAIAEMQLPIKLVVLVPAVENMPDGKATKPGDIVTSMSGQTIEILNTDAEGRLILCDALCYAERFKPDIVIDVATLTGACIVALGKVASGLLSNNDNLAMELLQAGEESGDRAWQLPLWEDYQPLLDSNFADMANIGGRDAGTITAACFLSRFTRKYHWAHLDIAGTAWNAGKEKGATGRPVPLLVQYLIKQVEVA